MNLIAVILSVAMFFSAAFASFDASAQGKLDAFEREMEKPKEKDKYEDLRKKPPPSEQSEDSSCATTASEADQAVASGTMNILSSLFLVGLMGAGNTAEAYRDLKESESPALPTIRFESAYQYIINDVNGYDIKAEAGYLMFGLDAEWLQYFEQEPNDDMKIMDGHVLLRTMFVNVFGINLALGAKSFWGNNHHTGFDLGFPFYIYLGDHFIIDAQPYWATIRGNDVYDIGGGVSYKYKLFGARAGYRLIRVGGENLHGPRIGLFVQY